MGLEPTLNDWKSLILPVKLYILNPRTFSNTLTMLRLFLPRISSINLIINPLLQVDEQLKF